MAFDLNAVIAEEAKKRPPDRRKKFAFDFDGHTFELPNEFIYDVIGMDLAARYQNLAVLRRVMKPADFAIIEQSSVVLEPKALERLLGDFYEHLAGLPVGESSASSRSSKSTARPSKRTSKSATKSRSRS